MKNKKWKTRSAETFFLHQLRLFPTDLSIYLLVLSRSILIILRLVGGWLNLEFSIKKKIWVDQ